MFLDYEGGTPKVGQVPSFPEIVVGLRSAEGSLLASYALGPTVVHFLYRRCCLIHPFSNRVVLGNKQVAQSLAFRAV